jgi:LemA protein
MNFGMLTIAVVAVIAVTLIFNLVIGKKNQVEFALASIDAQFKKRYDLIPNLIAVCEKYLGYEAGVLKDLTATRTKAIGAVSGERSDVDGQLSSQLRTVFAVAEQYPALRAADTFIFLQRSLNEVEEQLSAARRAYNASVMAYNNACQMPPTSIAARILGYRSRAMFEASAVEREPLSVWR